MRLLSWNIQCGTSVDGVVDITKTLEHILSLGSFDVICLQEIARHMQQHCASEQGDQLSVIQQALPDYFPVWGAGFSWPSLSGKEHERREFGNLTLVKSRLLDYKVHPLPRPAALNTKQMQRLAIETVIDSSIGYLSIVNTHLAFHDAVENQSQIERLHLLEQERIDQQRLPAQVADGCYAQNFLPTARILCGDFNFDVKSRQYQYQIESGWRDAWLQSHGDLPHAPSCGIYDHHQWQQGPHCRDFFWLSKELHNNNATVEVDEKCKLSDHQPVVLELNI